jgi:hypothetical protein
MRRRDFTAGLLLAASIGPLRAQTWRIAFGSVVGVTGATIVAPGTGRERNQQINLGKKIR